jgi:hypothetical protein
VLYESQGSVSVDHVASDRATDATGAGKRDVIMDRLRFVRHVQAATAREYRKLGRRLPDVPP